MSILAPKLSLQKTVNNPTREDHVVGFTGRDTHYGGDVLVLKGDAIPSTPVRVGLPVDGVTTPVYILGDDLVYGMRNAPESAVPHTFGDDDWQDGRITCYALKWSQFEVWDREDVEVTN